MHPTKMELRFADGEKVYHAVLRAVSNALAHKELIPQVSLEARQEKEARQLAEKLAPRPEPFEVRRRENLSRKPLQTPARCTPAPILLRFCLRPVSPAQALLCQ